MIEVSKVPDAMYEKRIQQLAYEYWQGRGAPIGTPEIDWFQAESEIDRQTKASFK